MDPEAHGGAPLLGFNGTVIKAHGSARERAVASAIRVATDAVQHHVNEIIRREIARANQRAMRQETGQTLEPCPPRNSRIRAPNIISGRTCSIAGVGSYVPGRILTNADLEKMVDTSDEWITTRTGIKERRIAAKDEFTSDLAAKAAQRAMKHGRRHRRPDST